MFGAIFTEVTAASSVAGTVANSVIQSKKNDEEKRLSLEVEKIARGEGFIKIMRGNGIEKSSRSLDKLLEILIR